MAKLSSTHIYGDLYVDGTISGALSGNASTATTLQTARTINGTSFNGSANITTANWGTSRTITIGNTGKSVNGSGNVSWTLAEIGAAASSHGTHLTLGTGSGNAAAGNHTHSYLPLSGGTMTGKITTPNNAQGITIGDDVTLCDRNIADHLVLEGSTATNGGITFGSGKDTNIYRGGANLLKTDDTMNAVGGFQWNGQSLDSRYAAASHGTHLTIGTGAGNAAAGNHTHNAIVSRGAVTCESGVAGRPAVSGISMTEVYSNGYPTPYGNVISLRGMGDGQILVGWSGTDGAHAPVYVRSKRDNTSTANWSGWAQVYTTAHKPTAADIGAAASSHTHSYLPLSGGTLTGALSISGNSKTLTIGTGGADVYMTNSASGKYLQLKDNGNLSYSDNIILHAANYSSYALPLSGGTVTGNLVVNGNIASKTGMFTYAKELGVATSDGSTFLALFRYANSRGYCDLGTNSIPGRLYIRSGQGTAGSGVCVECAVTNGTAYVQYLSPEGGTIALTKHLSDRTKKDNIVYVGSKDSEFTNKDFYNFIRDDLGLATYNYNEEYITTDTHTKLNFIAQDILYDIENNCENKVGNLIVQAEDAMETQGNLRYDPEIYTSVIAGALKESINKIEELEDKNKKLEERLAMLEEKFSALENK